MHVTHRTKWFHILGYIHKAQYGHGILQAQNLQVVTLLFKTIAVTLTILDKKGTKHMYGGVFYRRARTELRRHQTFPGIYKRTHG